MQDQGDRPARPGRPSLLSSGETAGTERQRILSALDGTSAPGPAVAPAPRMPRGWAWGGVAVVVTVLAAGTALFALSGGETDVAPATVTATAIPATAAVAPSGPPAPALAAARLPERATAASVPAEPEPAAAVLRDLPDAAADPRAANPLAEMAPAPARPAAAPDELKRALETPAQAGGHERKLAAKGQGRDDRKDGQARPARKSGKEKAAPARKAKEPDSDVILLAALMTHMQPRTEKATPAEQLRTCGRYNAAGEAQCRARVCEAAGPKEPACKGVRAAKGAPDS